MVPGRCSALVLLLACLLLVVLQPVECRPRIRHQRGGSHCSRCLPGYGAVSRCSRGRDTECTPCSTGTYSPHHTVQPCWICSRCGPGLYEAHPCTATADTVCDSCHRPANENRDYRRKCAGRRQPFLAPEDAEGTGEESPLVNEENDRVELLERDAEAAVAEPNDLERF